MRFLIFLLPLFFFTSTHATPPPSTYKSALRLPNEPWSQAYKRSLKEFERIEKKAPSQTRPTQVAVPIDQLDISQASEWTPDINPNLAFGQMRDTRFITVPEETNFLRRISWLYPDDGCFARAQMAMNRFREWKIKTPSKIFIFGNLSVSTQNHPRGKVSWWYHVAPIVRINNKPFILDAAIDPNAPMTLRNWVNAMTADILGVKLAICASDTYTPADDCILPNQNNQQSALNDQIFYLREEWHRATEMNRNPSEVLGDNPPW